MSRGRAFRREQAQRQKDRARWVWTKFWMGGKPEEPTDQWVGRMASTHCVPCSCSGCKHPKGNRRPRFNRIPTRQERAAELRLQEECSDVWDADLACLAAQEVQRERIRYLRERIKEFERQINAMEGEKWPYDFDCGPYGRWDDSWY
jgi:hypothetical protein